MIKNARPANPDKAGRDARLPPVTREGVKRLEQLADELDSANKEAGLVADSVRNEIADQLTRHFVNGASKKR